MIILGLSFYCWVVWFGGVRLTKLFLVVAPIFFLLLVSSCLLGKRISLISKKNIRYEGLLYSINEQTATVALQNVLSYGTEGREKLDRSSGGVFVAPIETPIALLLFRGQDIKDLHVHEATTVPEATTTTTPTATAPTAAPLAPTTATVAASPASTVTPAPATAARSPATTTRAEPATRAPSKPPTFAEKARGSQPPPTEATADATTTTTTPTTTTTTTTTTTNAASSQQSRNEGISPPPRGAGRGPAGRGRGGEASVPTGAPTRRNNKRGAAPGTGASLLNRKARGVVGSSGGPDDVTAQAPDYDFQSTLEEFNKKQEENDQENENNNTATEQQQQQQQQQHAYAEEDEEAGDTLDVTTAPATTAAPAVGTVGVYDKSDFFDSISCDALDKEQGIDNRLRGAKERHLNTETFGAVALDSQRRRKGGRGGGPGGYRGGGRGRGRGRADGNAEGGGGSGSGPHHSGGGGGGGSSSRGGAGGRGRGRGRGRGSYYNRSAGGRGGRDGNSPRQPHAPATAAASS